MSLHKRNTNDTNMLRVENQALGGNIQQGQQPCLFCLCVAFTDINKQHTKIIRKCAKANLRIPSHTHWTTYLLLLFGFPSSSALTTATLSASDIQTAPFALW